MESAMSDTYVYLGDAVKTLGNGKVGGYLVRYGSPDEPDLVGDYFTPETDFGRLTVTDVYYQHGLDPALKARVIGTGVMRQDEIGVWLEAQLNLADEYEKAIYELVKAGRLRWSSGTLAHLVERVPVGNAKWISRWMLGLDASLTPTPAEPRGTAAYIKSIKELPVETDEFTPCEGCKTLDVCSEAEECAMEKDKAMPDKKSLERRIAALEAAAPQRGGVVVPQSSEDRKNVDAVKAFDAYLRTGQRAIKAPLQTVPDDQGGYLVPETYSNELVAALKDASILRRAGARVIRTGGTSAFNVPIMTHSSAAVLTAESTAFDEAEPTIGNAMFTPYTFTRIAKVSEQLMADSRFNVMTDVLTPDFTQAFAAAENTYFAVGTGAAQPQGIVTGSTLGKTAANATKLTADDLKDMYYSLEYLYRGNGVWLMHDSTAAHIRGIKDGTGQFLWQPGMQSGQPDQLFGRPVVTLNTMPEIASGNKVIVFGDLRYYWIVDFGQDGMRRLDERYAELGQVGFRMMKRIDARVVLPAAIKHLVMA